MVLTNEDYTDILRHLQMHVRENDRVLFERLSDINLTDYSPRNRLLKYFVNFIYSLRERSSGSYSQILHRINEYVKTEDGINIDGLEISFSPHEQELYEMDSFDLVNLPNKEELIKEFHNIYDIIESIDENNSFRQ